VSACAVFFLAPCRSLQTVPLEIPILFPASSCDSPSRSASLRASNSAISMNIGATFLDGLGVKPLIGGVIPSVTGFGNLPRLPRLLLRPFRHMNLPFSVLLYPDGTFIYFCAYSHK